MNTKIQDGGPVFPSSRGENVTHADGLGGDLVIMSYPGLSIRDWFAGQALTGLCGNPGGPFQANGTNGWDIVNCEVHHVADWAYDLADAMLSHRSKGRDSE